MLARLVVPLETLQDLTANRDKVTMIYVKLDDPSRTSRGDFRSARQNEDLQNLFDGGIHRAVFREQRSHVEGVYLRCDRGGRAGGIPGGVSFHVHGGAGTHARDRGAEGAGRIAGLRLNILLRETVLLAIAGSILGILLSYGTRFAINDVVHGALIQAIVYIWWPIAAAIALVGAMLGAIYPGLKAARQDAIEALAYE